MDILIVKVLNLFETHDNVVFKNVSDYSYLTIDENEQVINVQQFFEKLFVYRTSFYQQKVDKRFLESHDDLSKRNQRYTGHRYK